MVIWYTCFIVLNIILFLSIRNNKINQLKLARTDVNMKLVHKYFKGMFIY